MLVAVKSRLRLPSEPSPLRWSLDDEALRCIAVLTELRRVGIDVGLQDPDDQRIELEREALVLGGDRHGGQEQGPNRAGEPEAAQSVLGGHGALLEAQIGAGWVVAAVDRRVAIQAG